jgi:hypothetical protein
MLVIPPYPLSPKTNYNKGFRLTRRDCLRLCPLNGADGAYSLPASEGRNGSENWKDETGQT